MKVKCLNNNRVFNSIDEASEWVGHIKPEDMNKHFEGLLTYVGRDPQTKDPLIWERIEEPVKICSDCGKELPATSEYFHRDKNKSDGLRSYCKECASKRNKNRKKQNNKVKVITLDTEPKENKLFIEHNESFKSDECYIEVHIELTGPLDQLHEIEDIIYQQCFYHKILPYSSRGKNFSEFIIAGYKGSSSFWGEIYKIVRNNNFDFDMISVERSPIGRGDDMSFEHITYKNGEKLFYKNSYLSEY